MTITELILTKNTCSGTCCKVLTFQIWCKSGGMV